MKVKMILHMTKKLILKISSKTVKIMKNFKNRRAHFLFTLNTYFLIQKNHAISVNSTWWKIEKPSKQI